MIGIKGLNEDRNELLVQYKTNYHYPAMRYFKLRSKVGVWEYVVDSWSKVQVW
jgi:hypothetical protein